MSKNVNVHKDNDPKKNSVTPVSLNVGKGDSVVWAYDQTVSGGEYLVLTSDNPSIVPKISGDPANNQLTLPTVPSNTKATVGYTISIHNGSDTPIAGGYLVIDTIGPPTYPLKDPKGHGGGKKPAEKWAGK